MLRSFPALLLAVGQLAATVSAANMVFGAYGNRNCEACLDKTFQSCPGDYQTRSYATCMCAGNGGANAATCMSGYCDPSFNHIVVMSWYMYCTMFFKELCPSAREYFDDKTWDRLCSPEEVAKGGIGASESDSGSLGSGSSISGTSSKTKPASSSGSGSTSEEGVAALGTGKASGQEATGIKKDSSVSSTSSKAVGATAAAMPVLGMMAGLGMVVVNMNG
ncbi:hypothetical protein MCOR02_004944 [Pyricularia oryzae]|nr:hypothetical protein MCOR02_004944 [Pyricularia oryzae]KAI6254946.1 hypothetical protein MCOR19_008552 [Pyricularia oryzae]KAI6307617.1 hypothetical protein MCOR34_007506 [Pyricularia oryzae]KAI6336303.1 hypothetical protein MCOR30_003582 [Pyricularia oryzae]KAI6486126.1 hypothetical protein MCOR18_003569 [Pyricularia oryzae]